jgi:hypothetical protein
VSFTLPENPSYSRDPANLEVLQRAERLGTLDKIDRTPQYEASQNAAPRALLTAVNVQGNHIRAVQADIGRMQHKVYNLKLRNAIIVSMVTAFLMRLPEIWEYVRQFFQ